MARWKEQPPGQEQDLRDRAHGAWGQAALGLLHTCCWSPQACSCSTCSPPGAQPPRCHHLCAPSSWPWAWGWLVPSTPVTPTPAASGKGEGPSLLPQLPYGLLGLLFPPTSASPPRALCPPHRLPLTLSFPVPVPCPCGKLAAGQSTGWEPFTVEQARGLVQGSREDRVGGMRPGGRRGTGGRPFSISWAQKSVLAQSPM